MRINGRRYWFVLIFLLVVLTAGCASAPDSTSLAETPVPQDSLPTAGVSPASPDAEAVETESPGQPAAAGEALTAALDSFSAPVQARGEVLVLTGQVLDTRGAAIPGARVEIWQTDASGVYDHPGDPGTASRDPEFQFYGSSTVDERGYFRFRTIVPGAYGGRPPHIHVKVFRGDEEMLTTQFYFVKDFPNVPAGDPAQLLLLELQTVAAAEGQTGQAAYRDLIVDLGSGGELTPTPPQAEGPYYPVAEVTNFDPDLAISE